MDVVTFLPLYLADVFHLNIKEVAFSAWVPYVARLWEVLPGAGIRLADKPWKDCELCPQSSHADWWIYNYSVHSGSYHVYHGSVAILFMALVLGGFQFCMTNLQTIPSDLHSGKSVGSLAGLGGASAVLGTILAILFASYITNWILLFSLLGALVPLSLCSIFLTVGEIKQINK